MWGMSTIIYTYGIVFVSEARVGQHVLRKEVLLMFGLLRLLFQIWKDAKSITITIRK